MHEHYLMLLVSIYTGFHGQWVQFWHPLSLASSPPSRPDAHPRSPDHPLCIL